jgi:hypothetical protein
LFRFAVVADGIYFIEPDAPGFPRGPSEIPLNFFRFAKGTAEKVFDIEYWPEDGLDVSPDERYVLFSQMDPFVQDLVLVENLR